jgi:hypothetical protein
MPRPPGIRPDPTHTAAGTPTGDGTQIPGTQPADAAQPAGGAQPAPATSLRLDLQRARTALVEAELSCHPSDRFLGAHLAALRVAAIVLALRARPGRSSRPRNAWLVLAEVAPELGEWAAFFAATEGKREAVRAGATAIITAREADDLIRDAQAFLGLVERALDRSTGLCRQRAAADQREPAGVSRS